MNMIEFDFNCFLIKKLSPTFQVANRLQSDGAMRPSRIDQNRIHQPNLRICSKFFQLYSFRMIYSSNCRLFWDIDINRYLVYQSFGTLTTCSTKKNDSLLQWNNLVHVPFLLHAETICFILVQALCYIIYKMERIFSKTFIHAVAEYRAFYFELEMFLLKETKK